MAKFSYRSSSPDTWTQPKPFQDPDMRRQKFGKIMPMEKPGLLDRFLRRQ